GARQLSVALAREYVAQTTSAQTSEYAGLWLARCDTLTRLADHLRRHDNSPLPLLRSQLRRSWEAILLERVTELRDETDETL
ncbi:aminoglycoside phosphotransferase family protein, partial [Streptomyces sp. ActVer]|nr:aminoglycoside phosphotransferase family protein [Streptomyces sp. ActVer]